MATPARTAPLDVFISYSHKDEDLRDALMEHLAVLQRERLIRVWHDRKIPAGAGWAGEIDDRLRPATSADMLAAAHAARTRLRASPKLVLLVRPGGSS